MTQKPGGDPGQQAPGKQPATPPAGHEGGPPPVPLAVVGVGASAGGLDAFKRFLQAVPAQTGMAYVLVPHLDPSHESLLVELLARHTPMPVSEAEEGMAVEADRVYVIPPSRYLAIGEGRLRLSAPPESAGHQTAIDFFRRSLAEAYAERAIGIVLSGTGAHGTPGPAGHQGAGAAGHRPAGGAGRPGCSGTRVGAGVLDGRGGLFHRHPVD